MDSVKDSPYITNFDLVPPSPPRSIALDFDHTSPGPFDAFEQSQQLQQHHSQLQQNPLSSPPFAHTPSYNGSYYNSPYSQHSELDFTGDELNFDLLRELTASSGQMNDYEPSEYDAPQTNSLLMFTNDTDFMSPHFSPGHVADSHRTRGSPFDHSSPASSNGADNDANANNNGGRHSRASSVASNHPSPGAAPLSHSPQPGFHNSPRLDVASSFGNMSVHTPNWGTQPLPPTSLGPNIQGQQLPSPPMQQKPQSPPRLTMPQGIIDAQQHTAVPTINAPDGDDGMNGPSLNIVPATPVSGGGAHGRQAVPFQQTLATLTQGAELGSSMLLSSSQSDHGGASDQARSQSQSTHPSRNQSPFRFESGTNNSNNISPVPSPRLPDNNNNNAVASSSGNYIFPDAQSPPQSQLQSQGQGVPQRPRSNSDTWSQPYLGGAGGSQQQQQQNGLGLNVGYDYQQQQQNHQIQQQHRQQMQNFTFGGGNKMVGPGAPSNNFLSPQPDMMRSRGRRISGCPYPHSVVLVGKHSLGRGISPTMASPTLSAAQRAQASSNSTSSLRTAISSSSSSNPRHPSSSTHCISPTS
ncbi:hypothetical protein NLJ89_g11916 [Agrocybe chaxingu]|uniref:Uncharacterized protein n=1 Tax=Agrocybe chaxingu TaxID=84603 RepID=A0A9W8JNG5_9AGAR|nr:hypothetical protein NLJ89_g11916 [Agrocybe chaxingu]